MTKLQLCKSSFVSKFPRAHLDKKKIRPSLDACHLAMTFYSMIVVLNNATLCKPEIMSQLHDVCDEYRPETGLGIMNNK